MGIIDGLIQGVTKLSESPIAGDLANAIDKVGNAIINHDQIAAKKQVDKLANQNPDGSVFLIKKMKQYAWSDKLILYDQNETPKYRVKGAVASLKRHLLLYDYATDKKLGSVKEKLITIKIELSLKTDYKDFIFEIDGVKIGTVTAATKIAKRTYEIGFNDWKVNGNLIGTNFSVIDGSGKKVLSFTDRSFVQGYYTLSITKPENEILGILLALALFIDYSNSKLEDVAQEWEDIKDKILL